MKSLSIPNCLQSRGLSLSPLFYSPRHLFKSRLELRILLPLVSSTSLLLRKPLGWLINLIRFDIVRFWWSKPAMCWGIREDWKALRWARDWALGWSETSRSGYCWRTSSVPKGERSSWRIPSVPCSSKPYTSLASSSPLLYWVYPCFFFVHLQYKIACENLDPSQLTYHLWARILYCSWLFCSLSSHQSLTHQYRQSLRSPFLDCAR